MKTSIKLSAAAAAAIMLAACETGAMGDGFGTGLVGGSGGSASTQGEIYRCDQPLGRATIRDVSEDRYRRYYRDALGSDSMSAILREAVQASNCFQIVAAEDDAIGADLDKMFGDQKDSERTRPGSDLQDGQAKAVDYAIYPTVVFKEQESGSQGVLGAGGALLGNIPIIGGGAAKTDIRSSEVQLELWSVRTRTRLAGGNGVGNVRNISFAVAGIPGIPAGGAMTQATKSPEGKATMKAMLNAYNEMVVALQNYEEQTVNDGGSGGLLESD